MKKKLAVAFAFALAAAGLAAFAQTGNQPAAPQAQNAPAPPAWCDRNGDGLCDVTGLPVGQGRGPMAVQMGRGPMAAQMGPGRGYGMGRGMASGRGAGMANGFGPGMGYGRMGMGMNCPRAAAVPAAAPAQAAPPAK